MGFSCRCGAVYADSDVAKFMQHVQKCSGGSKSGEGERAQPTPKGDKGGAVRSATASASRGNVGKDSGRRAALKPSDKGFQCHLCPQVLGRRDALKVHLTRTHKLSKAEADSELAMCSGDPKATCKHCGLEMNKKQARCQ